MWDPRSNPQHCPPQLKVKHYLKEVAVLVDSEHSTQHWIFLSCRSLGKKMSQAKINLSVLLSFPTWSRSLKTGRISGPSQETGHKTPPWEICSLHSNIKEGKHKEPEWALPAPPLYFTSLLLTSLYISLWVSLLNLLLESFRLLDMVKHSQSQHSAWTT